MNLSLNIKGLRKQKNWSQSTLGGEIGVTRQQIANYETTQSTIPLTTIIKMSEIFNISMDELVNGKLFDTDGNLMGNLKSNPNSENKEKSTFSSKNVQIEVREPSRVYKAKKKDIEVVTVNQYGDPNIVQLDVQAQAGWARNIDNPQFYENLPSFTLPGQQWRNDTFIFLEIRGDSMHPTIYNGDWVIAKKVNDFKYIREGYVHVVVTEEGVNCKRVLNRVDKRGKIVLKSDNPDYPTYQESANHIIQLYEAVSRMSYNFVNQGETLQDQINDLSTRISELETKKIRK